MVQTNSIKKKIIIICGATASGKSDLAIKCAKALNSEIISADSMNVYKELDIGTAKPSNIERREVKHHLIDVVSPEKSFTVSEYKSLAEPIINDLFSRGKTPIICGGTGFYVNSILFDLSYGNGEGNLVVREKYKKLAAEHGNEFVFSVLQKIDPQTAEKLHPNDLKRVIRAIEISENGKLKSDIKDDYTPKYDYIAFSINRDRDDLYNRINQRVDKMIENGLEDEVRNLIKKGITLQNQCMQGIGYKEIYAYLTGEYSLDEAIEKIKLNTRHYAKRQITFFKKLDRLEGLKPDDNELLAKRIIEQL